MATAVILLGGCPAWSQTGVAPSQTGLFFDDLRNRANLFRTGAVDESAPGAGASGVYDYSRGEYTGESYEERPMGERAPLGDDLTRAMGSQSYKAGYLGSSKRSAADYTGASSSQYPTTSTYFAPTYITDPFLAGKRNIKIGPVNIGLGMAGQLEYNNNITQSHTDATSDIIGGLYLNISANYQFSRENRLSLASTLGVDHYFNHPELSPTGEDFVVNVFPGSTLAFDVQVGDIMFTLYDRVSVRPSTGSEFAVANEDQFGAFTNDIGVAMNWAINSKLNLSLNYNRSDTWETSSEVDSQVDFVTGQRQAPANAYNRTIDSVSGSLAWTPTGTYTVGLESSFSSINYEESYNNDSTTATGGVFVVVPVTKSTIVKASGGWQDLKFDTPRAFTPTANPASTSAQVADLEAQKTNLAANGVANGLTPEQVTQQIAAIDQQITAAQADLVAKQATDNLTQRSGTFDADNHLSDYYYNVTIFNQLNARISHQLSFGHETSLNTNSNFITADYVTYGMGVIAWRGSRFSISTYYESSEESGSRTSEDVDQWGIDALFTHRLTDRLTAGIGYHYGNTDSSIIARDYEQNAYTLDFTYLLNQKMSVGLGYRFLTTDAEDELQSFDQSRVILSMNYNF